MLTISYAIGYFAFFLVVARHDIRRSKGEQIAPEARIKPLLYYVVLLPMGLPVCVFVTTGPPLHLPSIFVAAFLVESQTLLFTMPRSIT